MSPEPGTRPASSVNPEAGEHRITDDPDLLAACERAIETTYEKHPYYRARYAERGRSFSSSDSGWLVLVASGGADRARDQVDWLARLLAARGMPTVLLEQHLAILAAEVDRLGTHQEVAATLSGLSARMRARRLAVVDEAATAQVEATVDEAMAAEPRGVAGAGLLVASAVADTTHGLVNVESSLLEWLADSGRFTPAWVDAVHAAVARARAEAGVAS